jgi:hypothetical protein
MRNSVHVSALESRSGKTEGEGHKSLRKKVITNRRANRCTKCCTENENPAQNDALDSLLETIRRLSPEERAALIERLKE